MNLLPILAWTFPLLVGAYISQRACVVDKVTRQPIQSATVHVDEKVFSSDEHGRFTVTEDAKRITVEKSGYHTFQFHSNEKAFPDTVYLAPLAHVLGEVRIEATKTVTLLSSVAQKTRGPQLLVPNRKLAIWFPAPDSVRQHELTTIALPLYNHFTQGRIKVTLHDSVANGEGSLLGPGLLPANLWVLPEAERQSGKRKARIDLASYHLKMPKKGVFIVLEGATTTDAETYVKVANTTIRQTKRRGTIVRQYVEVTDGPAAPSRLIEVKLYPHILTSPASYTSQTWTQIAPQFPFKRNSVQSFRGRSLDAYNIAAELEITSW